MTHKPPTIEQQTLEVYLNQMYDGHPILGYSLFNWLMEHGVNTTNIARAFEKPKSRTTIERWKRVWEKQHRGI